MTGPGARSSDPTGAVGLTLLLPLVVAAVAVLVVATSAAAVLLAEGRAQDLADEAALTAARALVVGDPEPCRAATRTAASARYDVAVVACAVRGDGVVEVEAEVPVAAPLARRIGVTRRRARAAAGIAWP